VPLRFPARLSAADGRDYGQAGNESSSLSGPLTAADRLTAAERKAMIRASTLLTTYGAPVDRVWAYELLRGKPASTQPAPGAANDWATTAAGRRSGDPPRNCARAP
jgi:hypothetical protein